MKKEDRISCKVNIVNELGMHARPAAQIAEMAEEATGNVWISNGSNKVDASSIIDILTMCASKGTEVAIEVENDEDIEVMNIIVAFFNNGFGEN